MSLEERRRKYYEHVERLIHEHGWMVQGVFPTADDPGKMFHYSVGLHDHGLAELLVFSLPPDIGRVLVNDVARHLLANKAGGLPLTGQLTHERWPMSFYVLPVRDHAADDYATLALTRSEQSAKVCQIVWPDKLGRFPWDADVEDSYLETQPLLSDAPTSDATR